MKAVRFGIIGAGRLGNTHASNLALLKDAKITGVYDINPAAAQAMSDKHGAKIHRSAGELAMSPETDCVLIASPTYCHLEGIRAAVAADKPLFCEKPLTRTLEDARAALDLLRSYPRVFSIGFVRRHMAKSQKVKQLLSEGLIGRVRYCNVDLPLGIYRRMPGDWFADFGKSGGVIIDMLAHHVDLANWFFGDARSVFAAGMLLDSAPALPSDYVAAAVKYRSGVICNMMCAWQRFGRTNEMMEIYGDKGALVMDGSASLTFYPSSGEKQLIDTHTETGQAKGVEQVSSDSGFLVEMRRMTDAVLGGSREKLPGVMDGFRSLEIGLAMIKSAEEGRVVEL
jgi:predicted dehydrogenase